MLLGYHPQGAKIESVLLAQMCYWKRSGLAVCKGRVSLPAAVLMKALPHFVMQLPPPFTLAQAHFASPQGILQAVRACPTLSCSLERPSEVLA